MKSRLLRRFAACESGATAIEYGLVATMVAITLITLIGQMGTAIKDVFVAVKSGFDSAQ